MMKLTAEQKRLIRRLYHLGRKDVYNDMERSKAKTIEEDKPLWAKSIEIHEETDLIKQKLGLIKEARE